VKADLKALLAEPGTVLGTWSQIAAPEVIDLIGLNGFRFAIIDCEHGFFGMETAENLSRACDAVGIASAVRIQKNDPTLIMKALDAGIRHVVVPNVSSGDDARRAVEATRFGPHGLRGACPCCRSGGHFIRNWSDYVVEEEARTGAIALVESVAGLEAIDDILAVDELTAVMFGPFDLSVSMGHNGDWRSHAVLDAVDGMIGRAVDRGHRVMMPVFSADREETFRLMARYRSLGVSTFVLGSDKIMIAHCFAGWTSG
jgi:4-hydroxy-2-oxoheptanedioate aldolase